MLILKTNHQLVKYAGVGLINTFVSITTMWLISLLQVHYIVYTACGYLAGFTSSFILNSSITFNVNNQISKRLLLFILINIYNLFQTELIQILLIEVIKIPHWLAIGLGMCCYTICGFLCNRQFVFNQKLGALKP